MKFKILKEAWDKKYPDLPEEIIHYRGIPIQAIEVDLQSYRGDNWHRRKEYHVMDPKNPTEEHSELWDEWGYDLDSVKEAINNYLD